MKNVFTVFKKEMRRYFTDRRMLLSLFLPGVLIFVVYSLMGRVFSSAFTQTRVENTSYHVAYTENYGTEEKPRILINFDAYLASSDEEKTNSVEYYPVPATEVDATKEKVASGQYDLFIVFSDNFEVAVKNTAAGTNTNYINLFYNGEKAAGTKIYNVMSSMVDVVYKNYRVNVDPTGRPITPNLGKSDYQGAMVLSVIVPMLTMSLLFSSVMSITPDAVAGEKERGTLSAMLLTPIRRGELVMGKILALMVTAALSGLTSFLGLLGGLPSLLQGVSISFSPGTVVLLGVLIVTTLLLFVTLGTVVSTISKSVKECSSYMAPLMILAMAAAFLPLAIKSENLGMALIPMLNISLCMNQLLITGSIGVGFVALTIGSNLVFTAGLIFLITRLFKVERIMIL